MTKSVNQLINFFQPIGYTLRLDAQPGKCEFSGQVYIAGNRVAGKKIRLHAKGLKIISAQVNYSDAKIVEFENDEIELRPVKEQKLKTDHAAHLQECWGESCDTDIILEFTGTINPTDMHGLYECHYDQDSEQKILLATQFESHYAREVFPCIDEPSAKAKFALQINTAPEFQVLSNMPIESDVLSNRESREIEPVFLKFLPNPEKEKPMPQDLSRFNDRRVAFQMTPKMSPYLLAFVIGNLHKKSAKTRRGVEVNVYATPPQSPNSLDFALDVATRAIDFYEEYFGVEYPLPKSDHVALPDFSAGAMENWGLVTYRETALLVGKTAALATKQYIATVIAHELSHQWFGNLVTMKWWNDLWLNESLASLMEHVCPDALFPDWNIWLTYETNEVVSAMRRDALPGVQTVQQDVHHPDEISTLFDSAIVYAKGERLLKMLQAYIGEEAFRAGLQNYFKKFAYSNTTAEDLWECLDNAWQNTLNSSFTGLTGESSNDKRLDSPDKPANDGASFSKDGDVSLSELMNPWLTQPGYPIVNASFANGKITLSQERFFTSGHSANEISQNSGNASTDSATDKSAQDDKNRSKKYKFVILHGTGGSPDGNWFQWLKKELEKLGHEVFVPKFPTPENQSVDSWCEVLRKEAPFEFGADTILVGHSCGATYMLSILNEDRAKPLAASFFVSGFLHDLGDDDFDIPNHTFTNQDFDWDLIKKNAGQMFVIAGDNDPYVPKSETEELAENLDVEPIYIKNGKHLNAEFGYTEFPELLKMIVEKMDSPNRSTNDAQPSTVIASNAKQSTVDCYSDKSPRNDALFQNGDEITWPIPLFASDKNAPKLMTEREISFKPFDVKNFQLNMGETSHYIANYDETLREQLNAKFESLTETDRLKLLNEMTLLTRAGRMSTADTIDTLRAVKGETSWAVWDGISLLIADLKMFVGDNSASSFTGLTGESSNDKRLDSPDKPANDAGNIAETKLKSLVGGLVKPLFKKLGVKPRETDDDNATKLRPTIISHMIYSEDKTAIAACLEEFAKHRHDLTEIAGDLRPVILAAAVKFSDEETFAYLVDLYKTTTDADLRQDVCAGLTSTRSPEQIDRLIRQLTLTDVVRPQDLFFWFVYLLGNRHARAKVWQWCRDNWAWIEKTFKGDMSYDMFPRYAGNRLRTPEELLEFDKFFAPLKDEPALVRAIKMGHIDIVARVEWIERDRKPVLKKLAKEAKL